MTSMRSADADNAGSRAVQEGELLWTPSPAFAQMSNVARYIEWLRAEGRADVVDYPTLWQWSVTEIERFWASIWDYFEVESDAPY
ncbi:MAG: hypothetical protein ACLGI7_18570, partial [Gammaproteobacteria bacterium]